MYDLKFMKIKFIIMNVWRIVTIIKNQLNSLIYKGKLSTKTVYMLNKINLLTKKIKKFETVYHVNKLL